jgi:hypothetical protein
MPPALDAAIAEYEALARAHQLWSQKYAESAAKLRGILVDLQAPAPPLTVEAVIEAAAPGPSPQAQLRSEARPREQKTDTAIEQAVLDALQDARWHTASEIHSALVTLKFPKWKISDALARLTSAKTIAREGYSRHTQYRRLGLWTTAAASEAAPIAPEASPETSSDPAPAPTPASPANRNAEIGAYILREVLTTDEPMAAADMGPALEKKYGLLGWTDIVAIVDALIDAGAVVAFRKGRELHWSRASTLKMHEDTPPTAAAFSLAELKKILGSGASRTVADIHRELCVARPALTLEQVGRALDFHARQKHVSPISVGSQRRYRLTAGA